MTREVYIVSAYRSAVGKAKRGSLVHKRPDDLGSDVIRGVLERTPDFDTALIEDVILGCATPEAEQGMNMARICALLAGLPEITPGVTVNRFCSSGLQSIAMAADRVRSGDAHCIMAGGVESMSIVPMMGHKPTGSSQIFHHYPTIYMNMGLTAEKVASEYGISREMQDEFGLNSHNKALQAQKNNDFAPEIIPIEVATKVPHGDIPGTTTEHVTTFDRDEGPRADSSLEALARLRPVFLKGGTVTAGTSSQVSDGAAACLVCSEHFVQQHKLTPQARFLSYAVTGLSPDIMGMGPAKALPLALKKAGIQRSDLAHVELNEAFAAQALAVIQDLELDPTTVNPTGGAIALGHPLGATGAKLTATLLHGLERTKNTYGAVTMCIGTGMGAAGIFEALPTTP